MDARPIDEIIDYIKNLSSIKEILVYLVSQGIIDFSKAGYEKIKMIVIDKQNEGKYAFVPNKEEALFLFETGKNASYQQIESLVPDYRYLDLLRTGFLIASYNINIENNTNAETYKLRIRQIKEQIIRRPGGGRLLKIVNFPSTHSFSSAIYYLYNLKTNNYPKELLQDEFEEIVEDWEKSSMFVKHVNTVKEVIEFCKRKVENRTKNFSLLGMHQKAIDTINESIMHLKESRFFQDNNYKLISKSVLEGNIQKIEVIIFKDII